MPGRCFSRSRFTVDGLPPALSRNEVLQRRAVLTRVPPDEVFYGFDDQLPEIDDARLMRVVVGGIPIINTYVPNGYKLGTPQYDYKLRWYGRLRNYFASHLSPDKPALWCGDMNVAPEPIDVHSPEKHLKHVCFHEDVRRAYKDTLTWGFVDVFRHLYPDKQQFTFWDYLRPSSLEKNKGWRIDHILATAPLVAKCTAVDVDMDPDAPFEPRTTPSYGPSSSLGPPSNPRLTRV